MRRSITSDELRGLVAQRKRLLVLFSGKWCPDCTGLEPTWLAWTGSHESIPAYRLEVARDGEEWEDWDLDEIPTIISFSDGLEQGRLAGMISSADLDGLIDEMGYEP